MNATIAAIDLTTGLPWWPRHPSAHARQRACCNRGNNRRYHYDCPLDGYVKEFLDFDAGGLEEQLAAGTGDGESLGWILANSKNKRSAGDGWSPRYRQ